MQGHGGDFIEKDRAMIGLLKLALFVGYRAGKGSFDVTEKLAFKQFGRNGTAVNGDERLIFPIPIEMDGFGHQFFTGARVTQDQDSGIGTDDFFHAGEDLLHGQAVADNSVEPIFSPQLLTKI